MSTCPCYKTPKYLGKDVEFAYFEFRIPHLWAGISKDPEHAEYIDKTGKLPDLWWHDMIWLPVYAPTEAIMNDELFHYRKCRVPLCVVKSPMGLGYFAPFAKIGGGEMPLPSPDHEIAAQKAFDKLKGQTTKTNQQWEVILRCYCGREISEIYNSEDEAISALAMRRCGQCHNTTMQLIKFAPVWPEATL